MLSMNYFLLCAVFVLIFAYVVYSYMQQDASKAQALKEKVIVIDCRNQNEWDRGHVNVGNVLHIPLPQLENSPKLAKIKKDTPIMIHCAVGGRSAKGKMILEAKGYTDVVNSMTISMTEAALKAAQ